MISIVWYHDGLRHVGQLGPFSRETSKVFLKVVTY